jgi:hypothetical protein
VKHFAWLTLTILAAGCADNTPPPPRMPVPGPENRDVVLERDARKPLPGELEEQDLPAPGSYDDVPILHDNPPEQRRFVQAYNRVGKPRITVFVNRTLDGRIIPVGQDDDDNPLDTRRRDKYLRRGEYDDAAARQIDYSAIETVLSDWMACGGQVQIISPEMVRKKLSPKEVGDLQQGDKEVLDDLARQLNADVLIQAQARPTQQSYEGLHVRMIVEAIDIRGGQSIARAMVDIKPPLDRVQINEYTRFVARTLMDQMTETWENNGPER